MKIFISWSGEHSRRAAVYLRDWLRCVLNETQPFVSSEDIRKGKRWLLELSKELEASSFGIICLDRENLESPWILFEAGALSKFSDSHVCALLLDGLNPSDISGPLSHFQSTPFHRDHVKKLVETINTKLGDKRLSPEILEKVFDKWWPDLEKMMETLKDSAVTTAIERSSDSILAEILEVTRYISKNLGVINPQQITSTETAGASALISVDGYGAVIDPVGGEWNHPVQVKLTPMEVLPEVFEEWLITREGITRHALPEKPKVRGVDVELFFYNEQDYHWSVSFSFHKGMTYGKVRLIDAGIAKGLGLGASTIWRD